VSTRGPGRPAHFGVPGDIRELWAWGRSPVQLGLPCVNDEPGQLLFPLDYLAAIFSLSGPGCEVRAATALPSGPGRLLSPLDEPSGVNRKSITCK